MIKQLHPTHKACKCGFIGTRPQLYKHFEDIKRLHAIFRDPPREFYVNHGESILNTDDPRVAPKPILVTDDNFNIVFPTGGQNLHDERNP